MRYEDITRLTRAVPFSPFRVVLADGRAFNVVVPDMLLPTRTRVVIGVPAPGSPPDAVDRVVYSTPDGVRALEPLPT
jgi:hypothetical protein